VALALVSPALAGGFFSDDYVQLAQLERWSPVPSGPLDLYEFMPREPGAVEALRDRGIIPYFTAPDLKLAFLRPLSSALMWLDFTLFGRWPLPYHVHTLLWFAALLLAAAAVLRRALPPEPEDGGGDSRVPSQARAGLAILALLLFCIDDAHAMAAGWIAARNAAVACALVFAGLWAHLRWRTEGWRPGSWLAPVAVGLGLAAGEMGLAALAYLFAWELVERRPGRLRALLPTSALAAGYLAAHRLTGSGARASGGYLDPFGDPLGTLAVLPERALLLLGNLLLGTPVDLLLFDERLRWPLLGAGAAAALGMAIWLPRALRRLPAEEARAVRWLVLGGAGALLVSVPALVGERVLMAASLGGSVVLAVLLRDAWRALRVRRAVLPALGVLALALPNLVAAPPLLIGKMFVLRTMASEYLRIAGEAEILAPVPARVLVVAVGDLLPMHLAALRLFHQQVPPEKIRAVVTTRDVRNVELPDRVGYLGSTALSLSSAAHQLRRTAADTLELRTPRGTLLDGAWARTLRGPSQPMPRGHVTRLSYMTATVVEDRAGRPTRVELRFDRAVDDPSLVFLVLSRGRLVRLTLPAIGQEIAVPQDLRLF
jgi:hypothetical protein